MAERMPIIAANWKMHKTHLEAIQAVQKLSYLLDRKDSGARRGRDLPAVHRAPLRPDARSTPTGCRTASARRTSTRRTRARSPARSPGPMLAALDVDYVIVGHSERRQLFGEDDETVNRKVKAVFRNGMVPIVCVGETLEEREAGGTETKVTEQVRRAFDGVDAAAAARAVVAYEPIWAIGTGRTAEPTDAGQVVEVIRATLADRLSAEVGEAVRVQYGGSVKPGNIREFMAHPEIDGALVGGASLDPEGFALIVKYR